MKVPNYQMKFVVYTNSAGGVVLASRDGKIVCENTLDARLEVAFRKKLPEVKSNSLFTTLLKLQIPS